MGKAPCCSKVGIHKGPWTAREDSLLASYIQTHGEGNWRSLPKKAGLLRCGKSCRLRWMNYLRPDIKRGNIGPEEEDLIIRLHRLLGNRWSLIAGRLPGRTDNEIKNYWNSHLSKKLRKEGFLLRSEATPPRTKQSKASSSHKKQSMNHEICAPKPTRLAAATIHVMEKSEEDQMKAAGASSSDESSGSDGRINEMELHSDNYWSDAGDFDRCLIDPNQYLDLGRRCEPQFLPLQQEDDVMNFERLYDEYSQLWESEVDLNQMFDHHDHHHSLTNLLHPQLHAHT